MLLSFGVLATLCMALLDLSLRIPGNAILRAVFPMALGLALVPRQCAGSVMGLGALASATVLKAGGMGGLGFGALTSLALTGPLLDLGLWRAAEGWRLYAGFIVAGLGSNLAALLVRGGTKLLGLEHLAARPAVEWWPVAVGTYALCGALAGLLSAVVWFRFSADRRKSIRPEGGP